VLVLGVGGNVSQGIVKALREGRLSCRIVGACTSHLSAGLYLSDSAYLSPAASDPDFLDWLLEICRREGVDAILSGVEPVLATLSRHADEIRRQTGAVAVVASPVALALSNDKLATASWLREQGFPAPRSADAADAASVEALVGEVGGRLIAKPRGGKSGQGVIEVDDRATLDYVRSRVGYVLQERLEGDEYTVGCVCDENGVVQGSIALRRELKEGTTYRAEAGRFPDVVEAATRITTALAAPGPVNVQLRERDGTPVCFELNLRFSGTTPIRTRLGFDEVDVAIRHLVLGERPAQLPVVEAGIALRYWSELYVQPAAAEALAGTGELSDPGSASRPEPPDPPA
jgi:carbamoyl-phosphate synthase large subunit